MKLLALVLALMCAPAMAQTYADANGLGAHAPRSAVGASMGGMLHINAAILHADGSPADVVSAGEVVGVSITATRAMDRAAVRVRLRCKLWFTDARNRNVPGVEGPCFRGQIGSGLPVPLNITLKFRGNPKDAVATYGVGVTVRDEISGESVTLMPTWRWQGGRQ